MPRLLLTIHLARHGETTANREGIIQGQQDYDLTALGADQAEATAVRLRGNTYWQAHSSDLIRASRTAEIILRGHAGERNLAKTPLLREFGLGVLEDLPRGTSRSEARRIKAEKAGVSLEDYVEPRKETPLDLHKRAQQFLDVLIADAVRDALRQSDAQAMVVGEGAGVDSKSAGDVQGENARLALIVSHGGLLNVMMSSVMGFGNVGFMSNCAVAVIEAFESEDAGGVLYIPRILNDDSHMEAAGLVVMGSHVENFDK